jgi:hypothetical protein
LAAVAVVLAAFYRDAKPAIDLVRGTVYPGARVSSGGELTVAQVFGGFYGFLMSMSNFPAAWSNACEASNFVLLSPVPLAVLAWRAWRKKGTTALEWSLAAYIAVVLAWLTLRWPYALAAATGFGWSSKTRPLLGLGLASVLLCCVYLSKRRDDLPAGLRGRILVAGSMLALLAAYAVDFSRVTEGFASPAQSILVSLAACGAGYLLLARKKTAFAIGLLLPSIWSFGIVNPVVQGLGPIIDTKLFKEVSAIVAKDPDARWAVFGRWAQIGSIRGDGIGYLKADFIKATGARVFNGTKVVPPLDDLRAIDPNSAAAWTYNRYAHVGLVPHDGPEVEFTQSAEDAYTISIDPVGSDFGKLGIRYVALPAAVANQEFRDATSLVLQLTDSWMWVYEYR